MSEHEELEADAALQAEQGCPMQHKTFDPVTQQFPSPQLLRLHGCSLPTQAPLQKGAVPYHLQDSGARSTSGPTPRQYLWCLNDRLQTNFVQEATVDRRALRRQSWTSKCR